MNYFELFEIPVSFNPDKQQLKQQFYVLSRKYHPDFYMQENDAEQSEALQKLSDVNKAYKIFQHQDETIKYVLQQKNLLEEEEKYQLPPDFLMEMMDLNEQLSDAKNAGDLQVIKQAVEQAQQEIYGPVETLIESYKDDAISKEALLKIKEYYFKKKYLNRILEGID